MHQEAKFWNRIADRYSRKAVPDEAIYEEKLAISRRYFSPESKVFEFGCGTGTTTLLHAPYVESVLAVDFSKRMIEIAEEKRASQAVDNVRFECGVFEDYAGREAEYDIVLGLSVLHLLGNWENAIAQVYRMLKPGGTFISSTACIGDSMPWFKYVLPLGRALRLLPQVVVITTNELTGCLSRAGFEIAHEWQPGKNRGVFIVAQRRARTSGTSE